MPPVCVPCPSSVASSKFSNAKMDLSSQYYSLSDNMIHSKRGKTEGQIVKTNRRRPEVAALYISDCIEFTQAHNCDAVELFALFPDYRQQGIWKHCCKFLLLIPEVAALYISDCIEFTQAHNCDAVELFALFPDNRQQGIWKHCCKFLLLIPEVAALYISDVSCISGVCLYSVLSLLKPTTVTLSSYLRCFLIIANKAYGNIVVSLYYL
ncbi:hypothetical protein J6590_047269 [Homalodisca vitripennis]|nr:hypothetical protein J6590_047269 [Homalodisca vitripennis]